MCQSDAVVPDRRFSRGLTAVGLNLHSPRDRADLKDSFLVKKGDGDIKLRLFISGGLIMRLVGPIN